MDDGSGGGNVPVTMRPAARYFVGRMLMLGRPIPREQWAGFEDSADMVCENILRRMPVDNPASEVWDNRRGRG
ncbi:hypothetical protein N825_37485 [Skermanella stibiiresistens SB22]|uniref:Uncharacterized protein n=1 Tax=Skermanella stibiiresistens SB22 TaxID=1385369 RepID=W9GPM9_9PROT|nr:hypothetical protein N825_37485 [Skermanella stibiiresistens SB22]